MTAPPSCNAFHRHPRGMTMTAEKTTITVEDCMKGAFSALLRGDLAERDRLCELATTAFKDRESVAADAAVDHEAWGKP